MSRSRRELLKAAALGAAGAWCPLPLASAQKARTAPIIDSQVHAYERNHPARPWAAVLSGPPEMTGDQMVAAMDAVGVDGAVLVSPFTMYRYDASYVESVLVRHRGRFALVKPVDPADPAVRDTIAAWAADRDRVAIRILIRPGASADPADAGLNAVLATAARHSLAVNLQGEGRLALMGELAARHPDTRIAIDHLGLRQPREWPAPPDAWSELPELLALAVHPNIAVKISAACAFSREPFPFTDIWSPLMRVFDAFGLERCLWGTDWTRTLEKLSYRQAVDAFRNSDRLSASDRAVLMGGALSRFYRWSPSRPR